MSPGIKKRALRCALGAALLVLALILPLAEPWHLLPYLVAYLVVGSDIIAKAFGNLKNRRFLDEYFLMTVATLGAIYIGEYLEGVAVMLFYQIGTLFQDMAVNRSRASIAELMDIAPDTANLLVDNQVTVVDPDDVAVGDTIVVKAGERIPLDGILMDGSGTVDTSALTGESVPRYVHPGDQVLSGCVNLAGILTLRVTETFEDSTVSKILELVEEASERKAKTENFITRFARYYTPAVVGLALLMAIIPPVFFAQPFHDWLKRSLIFLVISCPCALVISVPLSFFGGIGGASKKGILIKGGNYLEALAQSEIVLMDKTGTLTKGHFKVKDVFARTLSQEALLEYAALAESQSNHPISLSIVEAYGKPLNKELLASATEISGHGVHAVVDGKQVLAGNQVFLEKHFVQFPEDFPFPRASTEVHIAIDEQYAGTITLEDEIKTEATQAIASLKQEGIRRLILLTGDKKEVAETVAATLGIDEVYSELLPGDKVAMVDKIFKEKSDKGKLLFAGDGINDAPVLTRADIGIAMGSLGSDAAIEAADVVLMDDNPAKIATAISISKKTMAIVKQNIIFALGVKFFVLALGALGMANMWEAIFSDVGVSVLAVLNAARALRLK